MEIVLDYYKGRDLYSDGDIENTILNIAKNYKDFTQILHKTDNWATLYHLSPLRKNLLEWYKFKKNASLLEIGGGCGALTGMFAEKVKKVTVIELSKKRAEVIFHRYKNYKNIEIIVGNFKDIKFNEKYDYITLIGVLEYSGKFIKDNFSHEVFLKSIKNILKPKGKLLIAIENKFGLKYWAGAREDHTGRFFDSIEDYPNNEGIKTFGRYELEELLKSVGFKNNFFYYPYPDYKLPLIIYSDEYLPDIDAFFFDILTPNFDSDRYIFFNERKAFKNIIKNKNFPFFANSFLVESYI